MLWAQLVFSVGLTAWRHWLIQSGEAELFVSTSPKIIEPLLNEAEENCPPEAVLFYLGDETSFYFARYQLYPAKLGRLKIDWESGYDAEQLAIFIEDELADSDRDVCLLIDNIPAGFQSADEIVYVNDRQAIHIIRK